MRRTFAAAFILCVLSAVPGRGGVADAGPVGCGPMPAFHAAGPTGRLNCRRPGSQEKRPMTSVSAMTTTIKPVSATRTIMGMGGETEGRMGGLGRKWPTVTLKIAVDKNWAVDDTALTAKRFTCGATSTRTNMKQIPTQGRHKIPHLQHRLPQDAARAPLHLVPHFCAMLLSHATPPLFASPLIENLKPGSQNSLSLAQQVT